MFQEYILELAQTEDSISLEEACLLIADPTTLDSLLMKLEQTRDRNIQNYIASNGETSAILTSVARKTGPKNIGTLPIFEVKYSMTDTNGALLEKDEINAMPE